MNKDIKKFDNLCWFILLISLIIIGNFIINKQPIYLISFVPIIFLIVIKKIRIINLIIIICIIMLFTVLISGIFNRNSIYLLNKYIDKRIPNFYYLRSLAIQQIINNNSNKYVSSYINMILFSEKNQYAYEIYNITKQLSISHLFIISGLHINILNIIINCLLSWKIKNKKNLLIINLFISIFFLYLLKFAISIIRIFLNSIIKLSTNRFDNLSVNCLSGIIFLFIFKNDVTNYGFMMSYFCTLIILILIEINPNKIFLSISINLACILISVPFIANMNEKINIYSFFYNYMYNWMIIVEYLWFLIFGWFKFSNLINYKIVMQTLKLIKLNLDLSIFIDLKWWNSFISSLYLSFFSFLMFKK